MSVALLIAPAMCVTEPKDVSEILSTIFFMSGLVTLLQSTVGTRSVQQHMAYKSCCSVSQCYNIDYQDSLITNPGSAFTSGAAPVGPAMGVICLSHRSVIMEQNREGVTRSNQSHSNS